MTGIHGPAVRSRQGSHVFTFLIARGQVAIMTTDPVSPSTTTIGNARHSVESFKAHPDSATRQHVLREASRVRPPRLLPDGQAPKVRQ